MTGRPGLSTCCCLLLALSRAVSAPAACGAEIVRLHRVATVDRGLVRLGDVADVFADDEPAARLLRDVTLEPAPPAGTRSRITLDQIVNRLRGAGAATGRIEFQGTTEVIVQRRPEPGRPRPHVITAPAPGSARPVSTTGTPAPAPTIVQRASNELATSDLRLAETVLETLIRSYLEQHAPDWGRPIIRPLPSSNVVPTVLAARNGNLEIIAGRQLYRDQFLLTIAVPTPDGQRTIIEVPARIMRRPHVLAAKRTLAAGQVITAADLEWKEVDDVGDGADSVDSVIGMETTRMIAAGETVRPHQLRPALLVQRNDIVQVVAEAGGIRVSRPFKAKQTGSLGQLIALVSLDGKETIQARVTGVRTAGTVDSAESSETGTGIRLSVHP